MESGYIKVWRKVRESDLWPQRRKYTRLEAWLDILLSANGEAAAWNGVEIPRGAFVTSQLSLAQRWRWSISTVNLFLKQLVASERILVMATNKLTLISVLKYDELNPLFENKTKSTRNQIETTKKTKKDNNKLDKSNYSQESKKIWVKLWYGIKENYPYAREKTPEQHMTNCYEIDKLHRIDGHPYGLIEQVVDWVLSSPFWRQNIQSGTKLREKFEAILNRMVEERRAEKVKT